MVATTGELGTDPLTIARRYLAAIEQQDKGTVEALLDPTIIQNEFPNRLLPDGKTRDRAAMLDAFDCGSKVMSRQRFEIVNAVVREKKVALEVVFRGTLTLPFGKLGAGDEMRASFAMFFEVEAGKIVAQRNYDCFDPF